MQESRTTLIGCTESVPAHMYKITHNPVKGALLISEVVWPHLYSTIINYFVSNTLKVLTLLNEIKPNSLTLSSSFIFHYKIWIRLTKAYSIRLNQTKHINVLARSNFDKTNNRFTHECLYWLLCLANKESPEGISAASLQRNFSASSFWCLTKRYCQNDVASPRGWLLMFQSVKILLKL